MSIRGSHTNPIDELRQLPRFGGTPPEFWQRYLTAIATLCSAPRACLYIQQKDGWVPFIRFQKTELSELSSEQIAHWVSNISGSESYSQQENFLVAPLRQEDGRIAAVLILEKTADVREEYLPLALEVPAYFEQRRLTQSAKQDISRLASTLDFVAQINSHSRFLSAAMMLCNELAARFKASRVGLGWIEKNYIVIKALSHTEKIEPKMEAVQQLAALMEESCDQAEEILIPRPERQAYAIRDHEIYSKTQKTPFLATLPIFEPLQSRRKEGEMSSVLGALTLERTDSEFTLDELRTFRLMLDQITRTLAELHRYDRWIGARVATEMRERMSKFVGVEHTWWKIASAFLALTFFALVFVRKEYRVDGNFSLKTDAMVYLSAPFDGHIEAATKKPGDAVAQNDLLVSLDTRELLLQKEASAAEWQRHSTDALKAESSGDAAGMRIAQARQAQAQAQMTMIQNRLEQAQIRAPFDGLIAEGDLRERIEAPVKKGDVLLKVARIENLYLIVKVSERDIQNIHEGSEGKAAFASQPAKKFDFIVEKIEPIARAESQGNHFTLHCRFADLPENWWRPGMSGVAKINSGKRSLLWIYTHQTIDFLRLRWW